jgi:hypothetical protein
MVSTRDLNDPYSVWAEDIINAEPAAPFGNPNPRLIPVSGLAVRVR